MPKPNPYKRERDAWRAMIRRCHEPGQRTWRYYGGKGITVCPEWRASFDSFLFAMGPAPTQQHWLGRLDVTQGYFPGNCLWTTHAPQMNRRGFCRKVMLNGQEMTAAQASKQPGQPGRNTVLRRAEHQIPLEYIARRIDKRAKWIPYQGERLPTVEVARRLNLSSDVLLSRVKAGWPLEQALMPVQYRHRKTRATP